MSDAAACALHFDVPSVATCSRCGRFCCAACLTPSYVCNDCTTRLAAELPALEGRGNLARYGLFATAACHALMLVFAAGQLATGQTGDDSDGAFAILSGLAALAYIPTYLTTIVLVCRWFHLATRHALARGAQLGVTPAGAVGTWFIPFVNLVKPFQLVRQMLATTERDQSQVSVWQALWVMGNLVANASVRLPDAGGAGVGLLSDALLFAAALVCARVIASLKFS